MESFPFPDESPPSIDQAIGRLAEQDGAIGEILGSLSGAVGAALGDQASKVGSVGSKLQSALGQLADLTGQLIGDILASINLGAAAAIQANQAQMNAIVGAMLQPGLAPFQAPFPPGAQPPAPNVTGSFTPFQGPGAPILAPGSYPFPGSIPAPHPSQESQPSPHTVQIRPPGTSTLAPVSPPLQSQPSQPGAPAPNVQGAPIPPPSASAGASGARSQSPSGAPSPLTRQPDAPSTLLAQALQPFQPMTGTGASPSAPSPGAPSAPSSPSPVNVPPGAPVTTVVPGAGPCPPTTVNVYVPPCPPGAAAPAGPLAPTAPAKPREVDVEAAGAEKPDAGPVAKAVCGALDPILAGLPLPGSAEFCLALPLIQEALEKVGRAIIHGICAIVDGAWPLPDKIGLLFNEAIGTGPKFMDPFLSAVRDLFFQLSKWLRQGVLICDCIKAVAALHGACQPGTLLGLAAVRGLMTALRSVRVGPSAPVSLVTTVGLLIPQVERVLDYVTNYACPVQIPDIGDAMSAFREAEIGPDLYRCWMLVHGADPGVWEPVLMAGTPNLSAVQVIEWGRRAGQAPALIDAALRSRSWLKDEDRRGVQILYDRLPTLGEIIGWGRAGAFDDATATRFGLDTGFAALWGSPYGQALVAQGITQDTAHRAWRAHWRLPSLGEAQAMLHRLYAGRAGTTRHFTDDDYAALVAAQDVAPAVKDHLYLLRYRELTPGEVGQLVERHQANVGRIRDAYRAAGYSQPDAAALSTLQQTRQTQALDGSLFGYSPGSVARFVRLGIMTQANADFWFGRWGFDAAQAAQATAGSVNAYEAKLRERYNTLAQRKVLSGVLKAYQVGTMPRAVAQTALTRVGMQQATAQVLLATTDAAFLTALAGKAIARVQGAYLKGQVTKDQAHHALITAGIVEPRATQYVDSWAQELSIQEKLLTASEIVRYFSEGLITRKDADTRLRNLGYSEPSAQLKLRDAALKMLGRRVKAEQAILKGTKSGQATLASLAGDAASQAKELLAESARDLPVKTARKYYEAGAITAEFATELLVDYGYTPTAAERTVSEWTAGGIATAAQEAAGKQPTGSVGTHGHG